MNLILMKLSKSNMYDLFSFILHLPIFFVTLWPASPAGLVVVYCIFKWQCLLF